MSIQTLATKVTVSAALAAGVMSVAPAVHALSITGSVSISGGGNVSANSISFTNGVVDTGSLDFAQFVSSTASLGTLTFGSAFTAPISTRTTPELSPFINFGTFNQGATSGTLTFALDPSPVTTIQTDAGIFQVSFPEITGRFLLDDQLVAFGSGFLSASNTGSGGSYSLSLVAEPVPTPALLPGLLGMGAMALRKRRDQNESSDAADS